MLNLIKIFRPNLGKHSPDQLVDLLPDADLGEAINSCNYPKYQYFDEVKKWPKDQSKEKFWALVKASRKYSSQNVAPLNFNDQNFRLCNVFGHQEILHLIDSGKFIAAENITKKQLKEIEVKNLVQEAIYSAQIEDAEVKPASSRKLLLESTKAKTPQDTLVKSAYKNLQSLAGVKTLNRKILINIFGTLRTEEERFVNSPINPKMVCYIAPSSANFEKQFDEFISFANNDSKHRFIHPVTKAIILHFWALTLKPFGRHNGIFARGIYNWYLQNNGFKSLSLLPLSSYIAKHLDAYSSAITNSAQDDNDITYFVSFIFEMLQMAAPEFKESVSGKGASVVATIRHKTGLNQRQSTLLYELAKFKYARTNFTSYMKENAVTRKTAADDLKFLEKKGYLSAQREGKNIFYMLASYNFLADV